MKEFLGSIVETLKKVAMFVISFLIIMAIFNIIGIARWPKNYYEYSVKKAELNIVSAENNAYSYEVLRDFKMQDADKAKKTLEDTKVNIEKLKKEIADLNTKLK